MGKLKRSSIPKAVEADVMFKSNLLCCICKEKGVHIHHLDRSSDNSFDNLALLCFKHHDEASKTGSLSKKISKETIIKFRDDHYNTVKILRQKEIGFFDHPIKELTEEKLLIGCKNALIIIELEKLKRDFFRSEWDKRDDSLDRLQIYAEHTNHRLAHDVFLFLTQISHQTRSGMTGDIACSIFGTILNFFPSLYDEEDRKQGIRVAKTVIHIGHNMTYDSLIHLRKLTIAMWGLTIIKFIYREAKSYNIEELKAKVIDTYNELEGTLNRPDRTDLTNAKQFLSEMKDDLEESSLSFPVLSPNLMKIFESEKK